MHFCRYLETDRHDYCTCRTFEATGKRCSGLWALTILSIAGPVDEFEHRMVELRPRTRRLDTNDRVDAHENVEELTAYWGCNPIEDPLTALMDCELDRD